MKRFLTIASLLICTLMLFSCGKKEEAPKTIDVFVTLSNAGEMVVTQEKIAVTDVDGDGKYNVDEVLVATHKAKYDGENGYATDIGNYGLYVTKMWGVENSSVGYYVNENMASSLGDEVKSGDYVDAYIYFDKEFWSDSYTFFDVREATAVKGTAFEIKLNAVAFGADFAPYSTPSIGSEIYVNDVKSSVVTDVNGRARLTFTEAGEYVLTAKSTVEGVTIVPPVCIVTVK